MSLPRVAIIYYSTWGHIRTLAASVKSGVESAGGKVVMPKTQISPEIGYMAFFIDSEGNKIGLHAQN